MKKIINHFKKSKILYVIFKYFPNRILYYFGYLKRHFLRDVRSKYNLIENYKNKYFGKRCFIVGTGPSLNYKDLNMIRNEIVFSVNSIVLSLEEVNFRPDFYMIQDKKAYNLLLDDIKKYQLEMQIFGGHDFTRRTPKKYEFKYIPYVLDLLNHDSKNTTHINKFSFDCKKKIYDGHTVVYSTLQLAIYMGFKDIYLLGVDLDYSKKNQHIVNYSSQDVLNAEELMGTSYEYLKIAIANKNVNVYNASRGGKLDIFDKVDLDEVLINKNV